MLFIHSKWNSLHLLTPNSQSLPLPPVSLGNHRSVLCAAVQLLSRVRIFATARTAAQPASLSFTSSQCSPSFTSSQSSPSFTSSQCSLSFTIEYLNIDNKESVTCKCRGVVKLNILLTLYKDFFFFFPISSSPFYEHFA